MDDCCRLVLPYNAVHSIQQTKQIPNDPPRMGAKSTTTSNHPSTPRDDGDKYDVKTKLPDYFAPQTDMQLEIYKFRNTLQEKPGSASTVLVRPVLWSELTLPLLAILLLLTITNSNNKKNIQKWKDVRPWLEQGGGTMWCSWCNRPRARTLLITCLRPKGLKVVPEPKFYADFKNPFLNCRKWDHLCEKGLFVSLLSSFLSETRINMFFSDCKYIKWVTKACRVSK